MSPKQVNYVTFESLYSTWFHKKSSNKAIHTLYVTSNKIVVKLFRYCSIVSVYGIANALTTLFKRETGQKSVHSTYKKHHINHIKKKGRKTSKYGVAPHSLQDYLFLKPSSKYHKRGFSKIQFFVLATLYFRVLIVSRQLLWF